MELTTQSAVTKEFLKEIQKENKVENISHDLPKSLVVTDNVTYLSPTAVKSFKNRWAVGVCVVYVSDGQRELLKKFPLETLKTF